jgi:hypothetical protein
MKNAIKMYKSGVSTFKPGRHDYMMKLYDIKSGESARRPFKTSDFFHVLEKLRGNRRLAILMPSDDAGK